ncbi:GNAT family N-acetyltransferase [Haloferax sp. Atlit-10N]|uniref:GNAT family N-acetyltransferase n=1 Tax=Haloferax TaxID=2251 RepID=UPI000678B6DD|nr:MULTISPECIES: GNAT family N-acetyltransferase [Haloferax]RDZ44659.1 GNAT family N-acetyltransferase [Haloferax sp. Atlit-16N]RDZ48013.1 GNAT family N-acetyltransferase [Haloferax sp. Atlit-19N]RDZ59561.1 GNAT family N-acetyltransferase [Haloferax sp. Atlit-10N]
MHLRSLPEEHRETYREFLNYAFRPENGPDWSDERLPDPESYHPRGFYDAPPDTPVEDLDAADLRTVCAFYDFTARVRGEWHPLPGISAVASPPPARRRGHVGAMLDDLLAEFRDTGRYLSALWPFEYAFYRRFGWATANNYAKTTVPPDELAAVAADPAGEFVRLDADDWARVEDVYAAAATEDLAVDRSEGWIRHRLFRGWDGDPFAYGWERDGDLRGYVVYDVSGDRESRTLSVGELVAVDAEARAQLFRFLRDHDSQVDEVVLSSERESTRLIDGLTDPRAATVEIKPGPMVRIVDVPAALEAVSFPGDAACDLVLAVRDDRCDWNEGSFRVAVGDGAASVESVGGDADPDATVEIGALSQLLVGARSVEALARTDRLSVAGEETAGALASVFTERDPYLREGF